MIRLAIALVRYRRTRRGVRAAMRAILRAVTDEHGLANIAILFELIDEK